MRRQISVTALCIGLTALPAHASDLDRYEAAMETLSTRLYELLVAETPAVADYIPVIEWDDPYRAANGCVIDRLKAATGDGPFGDYLDHLESVAAVSFDSLEEYETKMMAHTPDIPREDLGVMVQECGLADLDRKRMEDSGFFEALQRASE